MHSTSYLILGSMGCRYCRDAKSMLETQKKNFIFIDINTESGRELLNKYKSLNMIDPNYKTIPMIVKVTTDFLGGYGELSLSLHKKYDSKKRTLKKRRKRKKRKQSKRKKIGSKK